MKWKKWTGQNWFAYTVATCSAVVLYFLLSNLSAIGNILSAIWQIIEPIVLGIVFAYIMDPAARAIESRFLGRIKSRKAARNIAVIITFILLLCCIALMIIALIPTIVQSITNLFSTVSGSWEALCDKASELSKRFLGKPLSLGSLGSYMTSIIEEITSGENESFNNLLQTSSSVGSGVVAIVLGLILAVYFMLDKTRLKRTISGLAQRLLKSRYKGFETMIRKFDDILQRYIIFSLIEALIVGVANAAFMAILGMPYIALISIVVAVTNLAPTFGPIIGAVIGGVLLLLTDPWYALWFLIFTIVLQTIDGYILKPKLFGDSLGISGLLVIVTIVIGGRLFGAIGILLAIPFAAIAQYVVTEYIVGGPKNTRKEPDKAETVVSSEDKAEIK